jgi:hypothetical protein
LKKAVGAAEIDELIQFSFFLVDDFSKSVDKSEEAFDHFKVARCTKKAFSEYVVVPYLLLSCVRHHGERGLPCD